MTIICSCGVKSEQEIRLIAADPANVGKTFAQVSREYGFTHECKGCAEEAFRVFEEAREKPD
jgi:bacterioferritin-associated ferredoxin